MGLQSALEAVRLAYRLAQQLSVLRGPTRASDSAEQPSPSSLGAPTQAARKARQRKRWLRTTGGVVVTGAIAGAAAYAVVQHQRRAIQRSRPLHAPFPPELFEVLAPPGGHGRLRLEGEQLVDIDRDIAYAVIDGIPDFVGPVEVDAPRPLRPPIGPGPSWLLQAGLRTSTAVSAASAGVVARAAQDAWCLCVPANPEGHALALARSEPTARVLCLDTSWDRLREVRLRALEARLANLYVVRGSPKYLPVLTDIFASAWSDYGFHLYEDVTVAMAEIVRAVSTGGLVAGVSWVYGGWPLADVVLRRLGKYAGLTPGARDVITHFQFLAGAGLRNLRGSRQGPAVQFVGTKA